MCKQDDTALRSLFNQYANNPNDEADCDRIGPNGLLHLLTDLKLDPMDRRVLLLAAKLKAQTQCEFSWNEWKDGLIDHRVRTAKDLRSVLDKIDNNLTSFASFKEVYNFVFEYGKQPGQKYMLVDYALQYWRILFKNTFVLMDLWEEFLVKEQIKGVHKDVWTLLLDFCFSVKPDLSDYEDDGAWPVIIDQFVDFVRSKN